MEHSSELLQLKRLLSDLERFDLRVESAMQALQDAKAELSEHRTKIREACEAISSIDFKSKPVHINYAYEQWSVQLYKGSFDTPCIHIEPIKIF